jgi:hypothetical protein
MRGNADAESCAAAEALNRLQTSTASNKRGIAPKISDELLGHTPE